MTTDFFSNGSPCTMYMMLASFTEVGQMLCVGISSCASGITQFLKEACEQLMIWHLDKNCGKWLVYPIQFLVIPVGAWNRQKWVQLLLTFFKNTKLVLSLFEKSKKFGKIGPLCKVLTIFPLSCELCKLFKATIDKVKHLFWSCFTCPSYDDNDNDCDDDENDDAAIPA